MLRLRPLVLAGAVGVVLATGALGWTPSAAVHSADALDPIARLQQQIDAGEVTLPFDSTRGFLPGLLRALDIPVSSQGLVFSRTSLQTDKIAPWAPRALYFNDDVYIGYVQESHFLEIASMHPTAGAVFYTLNQTPGERPKFARENRQCLMCHQSKAVTEGVPGLMVLSTISDRLGYPIVGVQEGATTDGTPLRERYGGWYVTGTHGSVGHAGNVKSPRLSHEVDKARTRATFDLRADSRRTALDSLFDPSPYLSGHSDLVALMVLTHQTIVHNLMTLVHEASIEAARHYAGPVDSTAAGGGIPSTQRLEGATRRLVRAMFFDGEAPLEGPVRGTTTFAEDFARVGPRDVRGRSLRDFDLERRLFRYPFSFLVYSAPFDALPPVARREVYGQIRAVLQGTDSILVKPLREEDRVAIREIIEATRPAILRDSR